MQQVKRTTEEIVTFTLSAAGAISVAPFAVIRFSGGEWMIGVIDLILIHPASLARVRTSSEQVQTKTS